MAWASRSQEQGTVGQAGEGVVEGLVVELLLQHPPLGHVATVEHDRADVGLSRGW